SNGQFKEKFGMIAGSWRGKNILQRNAIIALANAHDKTAVVKLIEIIDKNNNPIHTATAIWALGEIVKKPNDEILEFMSNLTLKDEDSRKELELIRHKWQF
ncbi:tRNA epoxyqueuosine(34) reductase QueG, partial [Streptococcus agalactiae]|nr:tRNA epoxyqueuosine(34) reductase QueG [Streptococcus agalactiae]